MSTDCEFASFWHGGPLNPFAYACLATFPQADAPVRLYSYDDRLELPHGVRLADARSISPDKSLVPPLHRRRQAVDRDIRGYVSLPDDPGNRLLLGQHRPRLPEKALVPRRALHLLPPGRRRQHVAGQQCGSSAAPSDPALAELVATAESMVDVDQKWGALGPFLLTPVLEKHGLYGRALDPRVCYPIEPEQFWKPFLRGRRDWVADAARGRDAPAPLERSDPVEPSYDPPRLPSVGSYPHESRQLGALDRFSRIRTRARDAAPGWGRQIAACEPSANAPAKNV